MRTLPSDHFEQTFDQITKAAHNGDQFVIELFSEAGYNLGRGVAILIHIFNPELIVLSGRGSNVGRIWLAPIQQSINENCIPRLADNTNIEISTLGHQAELIGASTLVMENYSYGMQVADKKTELLIVNKKKTKRVSA
jgi:predicted NBD/HSP70 family sugar kinase